jgi:hypothetical protein
MVSNVVHSFDFYHVLLAHLQKSLLASVLYNTKMSVCHLLICHTVSFKSYCPEGDYKLHFPVLQLLVH